MSLVAAIVCNVIGVVVPAAFVAASCVNEYKACLVVVVIFVVRLLVADGYLVSLGELQGPREGLRVLIIAEQELIIQCSLEASKPCLVCCTYSETRQVLGA